jgi:hypothetical protein
LAILPPSVPTSPKPSSRDEAAQDGFLREVDEALREEQIVNTFKRYAKPVGLVVGAGLLALAGYLYWDTTQKNAAAQWSERMVLATERMEAGQLEPAIKDFELIAAQGSDGNRAAALMQLAAIAAQQGKLDEAAKKFAAIAADPKVPQQFRDLATVREVAIKFDTMKPEDVIARLKPIAVPGNAYFGSAGELVGMAYLEQGKPDEAGKLFAQIGNDKNVPRSIRSRMRQIAGGLGYDAGSDDADNPPEAEAPASPAAAPKP